MIGRLCFRAGAAMLVFVQLFAAPVRAATEHGAQLTAEGTGRVTIGAESMAAAPQLARVTLAGTGFAPGEPVGLWDTAPDAAVTRVSASGLEADRRGAFVVRIELGSWLATGLHRVSARGARSGRGAIVPLFVLPGAGPAPTAGTSVAISPTELRQLDQAALSGAGFAAGETVALWLTLPNGAAIGLGRQPASTDGRLGGELFMPGALPVGDYRITAQGLASRHTAIGTFRLLYGNGLNVPGARLAASIGRAKQRMAIKIVLSGMAADEGVAFWLTLPDGSVQPWGELRADGEGRLEARISLSEALPAGTYYLSVRGNASHRASFAALALEPGPLQPGAE